jgi:hypothetical protein
LRVCHRRRLRSAISVCPPLRLLGSSASRLGAGRPGPGRAALNELSGPLLTIHDIPQRGQKRRPVHGLCCILLPTPRAWHQDGPGELRKRQPVDRGRGLRYSCPPSGQGRCSRNRVGVELLRSSRRRRWIRRRYRFALPRRVDACGALAGSQRRRGGGSVGCRNGRADCRLRDRRGQGRRTRACQHQRPATASGQRDRYDPRAISRGASQSRRKAGSPCWHEPERRGRGLEVTSLVATPRVPRHPRRGKQVDPVNRTGGPRDTTAERTLDRMRSSRMSTLPDVVAGRQMSESGSRAGLRAYARSLAGLQLIWTIGPRTGPGELARVGPDRLLRTVRVPGRPLLGR